MSYNWIGNLSGITDIQSLGLWNNLSTQGYLGMPYNVMSNLTFSNMLSNILDSLKVNGLDSQNTIDLQSIDTNSLLKQELDKLGLKLVLAPQKLKEEAGADTEASQNVASNYQKWKANYDTVRSSKNRTVRTPSEHERFTSHNHSCSLQSCAFERRS